MSSNRLVGRWVHKYEPDYWGDVTTLTQEDGTIGLIVDWEDGEQTVQTVEWMRHYYNPPT